MTQVYEQGIGGPRAEGRRSNETRLVSVHVYDRRENIPLHGLGEVTNALNGYWELVLGDLQDHRAAMLKEAEQTLESHDYWTADRLNNTRRGNLFDRRRSTPHIAKTGMGDLYIFGLSNAGEEERLAKSLDIERGFFSRTLTLGFEPLPHEQFSLDFDQILAMLEEADVLPTTEEESTALTGQDVANHFATAYTEFDRPEDKALVLGRRNGLELRFMPDGDLLETRFVSVGKRNPHNVDQWQTQGAILTGRFSRISGHKIPSVDLEIEPVIQGGEESPFEVYNPQVLAAANELTARISALGNR